MRSPRDEPAPGAPARAPFRPRVGWRRSRTCRRPPVAGGLTVEPGHVFQALKAPSANGNPGSNHRETAVYVYKVKAPLRELADDWIREQDPPP